MGKKEECPPPGLPMWMATYSDMVTLLLTFFVLLLSMSSTNPVKFEAAKSSIENAFGWSTSAAPLKFSVPIIPSAPQSKFTPMPRQTAMQIYKQIKTDLEMTKINKDVEAVLTDDDTVILRVKDTVLFEPGKSSINPASYPMLRKIADIVRPLPMALRIEGHTDDTPVPGKTMSNWDLSVARAVSVMRFFNQGQLFPLDRMSSVGYGSDRPIVPNTSTEARAKNRRVDFILKSGRAPGQAMDKTAPF